MTRTRSPKYPLVDLRDAIARAELVYGKERAHRAAADVVVSAMGYTSLNGASRRMLATLESYGLLHGSEEGYRVSDNALQILRNPPGHPKRVDELKNAFHRVKVFDDLDQKYGNSLPSDRNIESYLTLREYTSDAARKVISIFRSTSNFISEEESLRKEMEREAGVLSDELAEETVEAPTLTLQPINQTQSDSKDMLVPVRESKQEEEWGTPLRFPLADGVDFQGSFKGAVTQEAIQTLIDFLSVFQKRFPKEGGSVSENG